MAICIRSIVQYQVIAKYDTHIVSSPHLIRLAEWLHTIQLQWIPGIRAPHKADHPAIRATFGKSEFSSVHIMYYHIQKPTRDSGHISPNCDRTP